MHLLGTTRTHLHRNTQKVQGPNITSNLSSGIVHIHTAVMFRALFLYSHHLFFSCIMYLFSSMFCFMFSLLRTTSLPLFFFSICSLWSCSISCFFFLLVTCLCSPHQGRCSSGGKSSRLAVGGLPVRSHPGRVEVSLSKTPNPQLLLTSWLVPCMAANRRWCVDVCVNGWMRGINCTALWIKALYKCSPFTIYHLPFTMLIVLSASSSLIVFVAYEPACLSVLC